MQLIVLDQYEKKNKKKHTHQSQQEIQTNLKFEPEAHSVLMNLKAEGGVGKEGVPSSRQQIAKGNSR